MKYQTRGSVPRSLLCAALVLLLGAGAVGGGALSAAADEPTPDGAATGAADAGLVPPVTPVVTSAPLPEGTVGVPFSYQLTANVSPARFSVSRLPAGLLYDPATARITGTPSAAGTVIVKLQAFGSEPTEDTIVRYDPLSIHDEVVEPAAITSPALPGATTGSPYSFQLTSNVAPVTFSVSGLPAGLRVSARSGLISGTPTESGSFVVRLQARGEKTGDTSFVVFQTLVVNAVPVIVPVITSAPLPAGTVGRPYSFRVTSNTPSARFSITGLPAGLTADAATGAITGTPLKAGTSTVRLAALPATPGDTILVAFDTLVITPATGVAGPATPPGSVSES